MSSKNPVVSGVFNLKVLVLASKIHQSETLVVVPVEIVGFSLATFFPHSMGLNEIMSPVSYAVLKEAVWSVAEPWASKNLLKIKKNCCTYRSAKFNYLIMDHF